MKKQTLAIIVSILLIGVVVAGDIFLNNKEIPVSKKYKDALKDIDLTDYTTTDYQQGDLYQRCLYKENVINTCSRFMEISDLDKWEKERIEGIAKATIERQNRQDSVKVGEGITTITSIK